LEGKRNGWKLEKTVSTSTLLHIIGWVVLSVFWISNTNNRITALENNLATLTEAIKSHVLSPGHSGYGVLDERTKNLKDEIKALRREP